MKWSLIIIILGGLFFLLGRLSSQNEKTTVPAISKNSSPTQTKEIDPVIVAAGDIACNFTSAMLSECKQSETANLVQEINPDAVLALGDLQYDNGSLGDFKDYYDRSWGKFKSITKPSPGNHEYRTKNAAGFFAYFDDLPKNGYYSFTLGDWHLIALNSNLVNAGQIDWLNTDLERNQTLCTLAYFHHPLFSSGMHGPNNFVKPLWEVLYKHNVDLVLNSHDHIYERFAPQNPEAQSDVGKGITQITVGTGGRNLYIVKSIAKNSQVRNNQNFGVLKLALYEKGYNFEFIPVSGDFKDSGSSNCN